MTRRTDTIDGRLHSLAFCTGLSTGSMARHQGDESRKEIKGAEMGEVVETVQLVRSRGAFAFAPPAESINADHLIVVDCRFGSSARYRITD